MFLTSSTESPNRAPAHDNPISSKPGALIVYLRLIPTSRARRIVCSLRHPVKSREFPAGSERLITADELRRYGL
jgi:hypothetical protein